MPPLNLQYTEIASGQQVTLTGPPTVTITGGSEVILTSGSDLDRTARGPWPGIIDGAVKFFNSFRPNALREVQTHNIVGNYGAVTSTAMYGFMGREFPGGLAGMPGPIPAGNRPMWNNAPPQLWGLRVIDLNSQAQSTPGYESIQVGSTTFTPGGSASLSPQLL
jgi:hypothetical protein